MAQVMQAPATRRTFLKVLGIGAPALALNPWVGHPEVRELASGVSMHPYEGVMTLDPAWLAALREPRLSATRQPGLEILKTVLESIRPYFSYLEHDADFSYRGYRVAAVREYRNEKGAFHELGVMTIIKERDLQLAGERTSAIGGMLLDEFAKAERSRGWTWNQATLVGYC